MEKGLTLEVQRQLRVLNLGVKVAPAAKLLVESFISGRADFDGLVRLSKEQPGSLSSVFFANISHNLLSITYPSLEEYALKIYEIYLLEAEKSQANVKIVYDYFDELTRKVLYSIRDLESATNFIEHGYTVRVGGVLKSFPEITDEARKKEIINASVAMFNVFLAAMNLIDLNSEKFKEASILAQIRTNN